MKILSVHYCGWGEDWHLGTLADDGQSLLFEYSSVALSNGLELSPPNLPLKAQSFGGFPAHQWRLPGLISDALPDGWGLLLMDRLFRHRGVRAGPLDRLALIGNRALGALRFEPVDPIDGPEVDLNLEAIAHDSGRLLQGQVPDTLLALLRAGGSPHGARPKALVNFERLTGKVSTLPDTTGEPWLVKFQAWGEHKEVCAIEHMYADLARSCGLEVPEATYFDLGARRAAFAVKRFDRQGPLRIPVHSLAGFLHADFRLPSVDYGTFLRATRLITRDEQEVRAAFARAVFNIVFNNRGDHAKNFAWRLGRDRRWRLAPAYDLTFSEGVGGEHQSAVCGERRRVTRTHLHRLARESGLNAHSPDETLDTMIGRAGQFAQIAADYPIRRQTLRAMRTAIDANCAALKD